MTSAVYIIRPDTIIGYRSMNIDDCQSISCYYSLRVNMKKDEHFINIIMSLIVIGFVNIEAASSPKKLSQYHGGSGCPGEWSSPLDITVHNEAFYGRILKDQSLGLVNLMWKDGGVRGFRCVYFSYFKSQPRKELNSDLEYDI